MNNVSRRTPESPKQNFPNSQASQDRYDVCRLERPNGTKWSLATVTKPHTKRIATHMTASIRV